MRQRLLIAESDAELCNIYQKFLAKCGFDVETASDGLNCLEKLRQVMPEVLVLDRELSWGGGDGVLAWLREQNSATSAAVILTATAGHARDGLEDLEPPVAKLLAKPFT